MLRLLPPWNLAQYINYQFGLSGDAATAVIIAAMVLCIVIGYLIGSLNSAIIISRLFFHRDIRAHGSKNAGATNMLRTYGIKYALLTMAFDMLKAIVATLIGHLLYSNLVADEKQSILLLVGAPIAGFFCVFGHMFPLYYRFKGGKGVACTAMVALMLDPWTFLTMLFVFVVVVVGTKYVSLASVMCAFLYPLLLNAFCPGGWTVLMGVLTTVFVVYRHWENIKRLYAGKESKISFSKKKKKESPVSPPPTDDGGAA